MARHNWILPPAPAEKTPSADSTENMTMPASSMSLLTDEALLPLTLPQLWAILEGLTGERSRAPNKPSLRRRILEAQRSQAASAATELAVAATPASPGAVGLEPPAASTGIQEAPPTQPDAGATGAEEFEGEGTEPAPEAPRPAGPEDGNAEPMPGAAGTAVPAASEVAPAVAMPADPWGDARTAKDRIRRLNRVSDAAVLDRMAATPGLQTAVDAELSRQRRYLAEVEGLLVSTDGLAALRALEELRYLRRVVERPGLLSRVREAIAELEALRGRGVPEGADAATGAAAEGGATAEPAPSVDPVEMCQARGDIDERVNVVRALSSIAVIDLMAASSPPRALQSRVIAELAMQRALLVQVEEVGGAPDAAAARGKLHALIGNRRTHSRPGVVAAIRRQLAGLDPAEGADGASGTNVAVSIEDRPLADLTVEELKTAYRAEIGRDTGSIDRGYLIWKIREARKGRIKVGRVERTQRDPAAPQKVMPVRLVEAAVARMDEAIAAAGYSTRLSFIREALAEKLERLGAGEAAQAIRLA